MITPQLNFANNYKFKNEKRQKYPCSKGKKISPGCNPENKFKKGTTASSVSNIITSVAGNVKAKSGSGFANEGTNVDYNEER